MTIPPLSLILLLGALQGFILTTLLWLNPKGNRLSNRLLATLIGLLALMSSVVGMPATNRFVGLFFDLVPLIMAMPLGPLIFFYTRSMLDPSFRIGKRERLHFYPVVLDWGSKIIGWVFLIGMLLGFFSRREGPTWNHVMDEYDVYADIPRWLSVTIYLILTRQVLSGYQADGNGANCEHQGNVNWLRQFVNAFLIFQIIWLIHLVPYVIPAFREPLLDRFGWYPIYIPITVLIYWLGLKGYLHTRTTVVTNPIQKPAGAELPEATIRQVISSLSKAMTMERLFLDPELSLEKVSQHTQVSPKLISAVLNQHVRKNFNTFVNEHRVEAVKQRLTDPAYERLTLTGIAFDCGFNSQATFQRTFRQLTGLSPGEYASQQKNTTQIRI